MFVYHQSQLSLEKSLQNNNNNNNNNNSNNNNNNNNNNSNNNNNNNNSNNNNNNNNNNNTTYENKENYLDYSFSKREQHEYIRFLLSIFVT